MRSARQCLQTPVRVQHEPRRLPRDRAETRGNTSQSESDPAAAVAPSFQLRTPLERRRRPLCRTTAEFEKPNWTEDTAWRDPSLLRVGCEVAAPRNGENRMHPTKHADKAETVQLPKHPRTVCSSKHGAASVLPDQRPISGCAAPVPTSARPDETTSLRSLPLLPLSSVSSASS